MRKLLKRHITITTAILSVLLMNLTDVSAQQRSQQLITEDLGNPNWEEIIPELYIDTNLVHQNEDIIIFDTFTDFDIVYVRFDGNCNTMTLKELRIGGFAEQTVGSFIDVSNDLSRQHNADEGTQHHALLNAACKLKRP